MLRASNPRARCFAASFAKAGALSVLLSGCHPFGCESSRCVDEHVYADSKRCNAVLEASLVIVRNSRLPSGANFDASAIRSELIDRFDRVLANGAKLGMSGDAVYKDVEQAKVAYLSAYAERRTESPQQKLHSLFEDVNDCIDPGGPND